MEEMLKKIILEEILNVLKEQEIPSYKDYGKTHEPGTEPKGGEDYYRIKKQNAAERNLNPNPFTKVTEPDAIKHTTDSGIFSRGITPEQAKTILNGDPKSLADYMLSQAKSSHPNHYEKYLYDEGLHKLEKRIFDFIEKANRYALAGEKSGLSKQQAMDNQKQAYTLAKTFATRITASVRDFETLLTREDQYSRAGRAVRRFMEVAKTGIMPAEGGMKLGLPTTGKFNPDGTEKVSSLQEKTQKKNKRINETI